MNLRQIKFLKSAFPYIGDAVYKCFLCARKNLLSISQEMKLADLEASSGWVKRFKKWFGIKSRLFHGETGRINHERGENLQQEIGHYCSDDI